MACTPAAGQRQCPKKAGVEDFMVPWLFEGKQRLSWAKWLETLTNFAGKISGRSCDASGVACQSGGRIAVASAFNGSFSTVNQLTVLYVSNVSHGT